MLLDQNGNEIAMDSGAVQTASEPMRLEPPDPPEQIAAWQAELDKLAEGSGERLTTLRLVWVPGDHWNPVNRYYVYQMFPVGTFPFGVSEEELRGPDPRSYAGDYDETLGRFIRHKELTIDRQQWRVFQETGQFGMPYWVIQGEGGGHLRHFTPVQRSLSEFHGGPPHPPAPGDLPFARPDRRTWEALREMDELAKHEGLIAFDLRAPHMIQDAQKAKAKAFREKLWNHLKNQQEAIWSDEGGALRALRDSLPHGVGSSGKGPDYELIERKFIEE